jgi:hypothetical protein
MSRRLLVVRSPWRQALRARGQQLPGLVVSAERSRPVLSEAGEGAEAALEVQLLKWVAAVLTLNRAAGLA